MSTLRTIRTTLHVFKFQTLKPLFVRQLSTENITENLRYRPANATTLYTDRERPLVMLYAWLGAKSKHIDKFECFYSDKGFDVLKIKIKPHQLLWPKYSQSVINSVFEFVNSSDHSEQPLLVHAFSVGAYLYGEGLHKIKHTDDEIYKNVVNRVKGQVFDSPVDSNNIPFGFSRAIFDKPLVQNGVERLITGYLNTFDASVTRHYRRSSAAFYDTPVSAPALFYYSKRDVVALVDNVRRVVDTWRRARIQVDCVEFESPHVLHYQRNPAAYIEALEAFLSSVGLNENYDATAAVGGGGASRPVGGASRVVGGATRAVGGKN